MQYLFTITMCYFHINFGIRSQEMSNRCSSRIKTPGAAAAIHFWGPRGLIDTIPSEILHHVGLRCQENGGLEAI